MPDKFILTRGHVCPRPAWQFLGLPLRTSEDKGQEHAANYNSKIMITSSMSPAMSIYASVGISPNINRLGLTEIGNFRRLALSRAQPRAELHIMHISNLWGQWHDCSEVVVV